MAGQINKLLTWNIKGLKRHIGLLNDYFKNADIICLQETWLRDFEDNILDEYFPHYKAMHKSSMKADVFYAGRPFGGVVTLWKNSLDSCIENWDTDFDNFLVTKVKTNNGNFFIVNVYFLTNITENHDLNSVFISRIISVWTLDEVDDILVCGDFNLGINTTLYKELVDACSEHKLTIVDRELLPNDSFTFLSDMNGGNS